jgi:hypothetical protein
LTANEVEEVLKDAFAGTDHLVPTQDAQEGTTPVGNCPTSGSSAPSLGCIDTAYHPIHRGASHPRVSEVRPHRHDCRGFLRNGSVSQRIRSQGNDCPQRKIMV